MMVQNDGSKERKIARMKRNIYSLFDLSKLLKQSNFRYIKHLIVNLLLFLAEIFDKITGYIMLSPVIPSNYFLFPDWPVRRNGK